MNRKDLKSLKEFCDQNPILIPDSNSFNKNSSEIKDNLGDEIIDKIKNNEQIGATINNIFDFIDDNLIEQEEIEFINLNYVNQEEKFLEKLANLVISENPSSTFINKLLKSLKETIFPGKFF